MKIKTVITLSSFITAFNLNLGCSSNDGSNGNLNHSYNGTNSNGNNGFPSENVSNSISQLAQSKSARLDLSLTDAPNKNLSSVVVDVDHMEVLLSKSGKGGRLVVNQGLGPIDLLKLQNGITLALSQIQIPEGVQIQQLRLILKESGHFAVKSNGDICSLKTPSAQKTGLKIILTNQFTFESGAIYKVLIDFDALKSVVVKGNGDCLLKPVIKIKTASKIISDQTPNDESTDTDSATDEVPIITDNSNTAGDSSAGDSSSGSTDTSGSTSGTTSGSTTTDTSTTTTPDDSAYVTPTDLYSDYTELDLLELNNYYNTQP